MKIFSNKEERPAVKVSRTVEGTVFEIAVAIILIASWIYILVNIDKLPASFPFFQCIVTSVVALCMLAVAYFPNSINMPIKVRTPRQYALTIRMVRLFGLIFSMAPAAMVFGGIPLSAVIVSTMIIVLVVFCVLVYRAR